MENCCPANSEPYLAADYQATGQVVSSKNIEYY